MARRCWRSVAAEAPDPRPHAGSRRRPARAKGATCCSDCAGAAPHRDRDRDRRGGASRAHGGGAAAARKGVRVRLVSLPVVGAVRGPAAVLSRRGAAPRGPGAGHRRGGHHLRLAPLGRRARRSRSASTTSAPRRRRSDCSRSSDSRPSGIVADVTASSCERAPAVTNPLDPARRPLGQSPWYDFITRDLVSSGELARLIAEDGLRGDDLESDDLREGDRRQRPTTTTTSAVLAAEGRPPAGDLRGAGGRGCPRGLRSSSCRSTGESRGHGRPGLDRGVADAGATTRAGTIAEAERLWSRGRRGPT